MTTMAKSTNPPTPPAQDQERVVGRGEGVAEEEGGGVTNCIDYGYRRFGRLYLCPGALFRCFH